MGLKDRIQTLLKRINGAETSDAEPEAEGADAGSQLRREENLKALEVKLGYSFRDRSHLHNALLHRSHVHVTGLERGQSNERLEFLGDAVLGLVVNEELYHCYPDHSEGDLTKMKSLLVCGARLSEVAGEVDLGVHIRMSRSEAATGGRKRSSILADTMEALIGAIYLDGGLAAARDMIRRVVLAGSRKVLSRRSMRNYKSRLQELIQARYKSPPRYKVLDADGPDHDRVFKVAVTFGGHQLGMGSGGNKKSAEQDAAREALDLLEKTPDYLGGDEV